MRSNRNTKWRRLELTCDQLWRRIVLKLWDYHCGMCGAHAVQVHHIIKRRFKLTRHHILCGMPCCQSCHEAMEAKGDFEYLLAEDPRNLRNKTWDKHYDWATEFRYPDPVNSINLHYEDTLEQLKELAVKFKVST